MSSHSPTPSQYGPRGYCRVREGQILNKRYLLKTKLGFGYFSIVWLAIDLMDSTHQQVAIKIQKGSPSYTKAAHEEKDILHQLHNSTKAEPVIQPIEPNQLTTPPPLTSSPPHNTTIINKDESPCIIKLYDFFIHDNHCCLVFEPMWKDLYFLIKNTGFEGFPVSFAKIIFYQVLLATAQCHKKGIIHTDLKPENFLVSEFTPNRPFIVKMADLGNGCWTHHRITNDIQTRQYRSPEVLLGLPWSTEVDMFSCGIMLVELIIGQCLFNPLPTKDVVDRNQIHLALMMQILGNLPLWMIKKGRFSNRYFDRYQRFRSIYYLSKTTLAAVVKKHRPDIDMTTILDICNLAQQLLALDPNKRLSAQKALKHPWLKEVHQNYKLRGNDAFIINEQMFVNV